MPTGNAFIRFKKDGSPVKAESLTEPFKGDSGWIETGDWSWDIESETSIQKGSGASMGKPTSGTFSWSHAYDVSSPTLMDRIVKGVSFETAELVMLKQTGKGEPEVYYAMRMGNVFITKVSTKGGEDGAVSQDIEMVFTEVAIGYLMQGKDNALITKPVPFGWDITSQKVNEAMAAGLPASLGKG